jgi:ribonuclease R
LKGVLDITRSGMGFVIVEILKRIVLIRPEDFNTALHGDIVRVKIKNDGGRRMQGVVDVSIATQEGQNLSVILK